MGGNYQRLVTFAFECIAASLAPEQGSETSVSLRPEADGSWSPLLRYRTGFFKGLVTATVSPRTIRVVEHLCAGAIGREVVEKLWEAVTNMPEPGNARADLLRFLHDQRLFELIVHLAARYEPPISAKIGQLLELRNVVSGRPDLVPVAQSVAKKIADGAKPGPFRIFIRALPSATQVIEARLILTVEQGLVLRPSANNVADLQIPLSIEPRG
jgi:hypothetical protein